MKSFQIWTSADVFQQMANSGLCKGNCEFNFMQSWLRKVSITKIPKTMSLQIVNEAFL